MKIKTTGFKELEQALSQIEKKATQKAVMRRALKKSAQPVADLAQLLVAKGAPPKLAPSIKVLSTLSRRQKGLHRSEFKGRRSAVELFVGPNTDPAGVALEFGTVPHNNGGKFKGTKHPGTAPQPFMRPAWDREGKKTLDRVGALMWAEIDAQAKRSAKAATRAAQKNGWEV